MKDEWAELLASARYMPVDVIPKGWKTIYQLQKDYYPKMTVVHVRALLNQLFADKKVERRKFRIVMRADCPPRRVFHYRKI